METAEDYRSIQQDCEQLTRLGCNGDHAVKQIVPVMSNVRCTWYKQRGLPPRQPAPRYELEPSYDIALQYENALREFPDHGLIYDSYQCLIADCVAQYNMITQYITCIPRQKIIMSHPIACVLICNKEYSITCQLLQHGSKKISKKDTICIS